MNKNWTMNFIVKCNTIKFLQENTGENHIDNRFGHILDITAKAKYRKEKNGKS